MRTPKLGTAYVLRFFNGGHAFVSITGSSLECWTDEGGTRIAAAKFPYLSGLDIAPDGRRVLVKSTTGHLAVFSLTELNLLASPTHWKRVHEGPAALFSPCGEFAVDGRHERLPAVLRLRPALGGLGPAGSTHLQRNLDCRNPHSIGMHK